MNIYCQTRKHTENQQLSDKRKLHDEETFSKKLQSAAGVEKKFYGQVSCSAGEYENFKDFSTLYWQQLH